MRRSRWGRAGEELGGWKGWETDWDIKTRKKKQINKQAKLRFLVFLLYEF